MRKTLGYGLAAMLAAAIFAAAAMAADGPYWDFDEFYKYDKDLPFNLEEKVIKETDLYVLYHWTYDSIHDKRVTAQLMVPKGLEEPPPVFFSLHGYGGNKEDFNRALDYSAEQGYACLALDAEYMGERKVEGKAMYSKLAYSSRDAMIQTIVDHMRGLDILETRDDVDATRVGFVGGSMGGIFGAVQAAVEPRIKASVLAVGGADWGYLLRASVVAEALGLNSGDNPLDPDDFRRIVAPADPIQWAQRISPRPVLMLNAKHDILVNPKANKLLFWRLKEPKKLIWFDEGHELPFDICMNYALEFFDKYLKGDADPAEIGAQITGHETEPMPMDLNRELPPPRTKMPLAWLYDYEDYLPLNEEVAAVAEPPAGAAEAYDVSFMSVHDKRVPGRLYLPGPKEQGPYPAVIFFHQVGADFSEAEKILPAAREAGVAVFSFDLEYSGSRARPDRALISPQVYTTRDAAIQSVFDLRRTMDFLETQSDKVDSEKGFAVLKYGVSLDAVVREAAGLDDRIGTIVIVQESMNDSYKVLEKIKFDVRTYHLVDKAFSPEDNPAGDNVPECLSAKTPDGKYPTGQLSCDRVNTAEEALLRFSDTYSAD